MNYSNNDLQQFLKFTKKISLEASKILLRYRKRISSIKITDKNKEGVASEADIASEKLVIDRILKKYPSHKIVAEEQSFLLGGCVSDDQEEWTWIIDPLDGTNNFLAGLDYFAVSIALAYRGMPVVGVVYRPVTLEMYWAVADKGAYYRKGDGRAKKLVLSDLNRELRDVVVANGFNTEKGADCEAEFSAFLAVLKRVRAARRMGSAALDLCHVAQGLYHGFWEVGLSSWDVAAAALICEQAGARVTNFSGDRYCPFEKRIIAAAGNTHADLLKILSPFLKTV